MCCCVCNVELTMEFNVYRRVFKICIQLICLCYIHNCIQPIGSVVFGSKMLLSDGLQINCDVVVFCDSLHNSTAVRL